MHIRKKSILHLTALPAADDSLFIAHSLFSPNANVVAQLSSGALSKVRNRKEAR
jgi:hypothetical protein